MRQSTLARPTLARRVLLWIVVTAALAVVTTGAVGTTGKSGTSDPTQALFPRLPATTWVYAMTTEGRSTGLVVDRVVGRAQLRDGLAVEIESAYEDFLGRGAPLTTRRYVSTIGTRVVEHGSRDRAEYRPVEPPMPVFLASAKPGQTADWTGTQGGDPAAGVLTFVGEEDITVADRDYHGCRRHRSVVKITGDMPSVDTYDAWYCPGVGAVRSTERFVSATMSLRVVRDLVAFASADLTFHTAAASSAPVRRPGVTAPLGREGGPDQGRGGTNVVAGSLDTTRYAWTDRRDGAPVFAPVGDGRRVVVSDREGHVTSTDVRTGELAWRTRVSPPVVARPSVGPGQVFVADGAKSLLALDSATGGTRWATTFDDVVSAAPVVSDGVVVVAVEDRTVRGLAADDGRPLWTVRRDELVPTGLAVDGELVYFADAGGTVAALGLHDGLERWTFELDGPAATAPALTEGTLVVSDAQGHVDALDSRTGRLRWGQYRERTVTRQPAVSPRHVVLVLDDDHVEVLDTRTGASRWQRPVPQTGVPAVIAGDDVVVLDGLGRPRRYDVASGVPGSGGSLPALTGGDTVATVPMAAVDGALVVTLRHRTDDAMTLLALPLGRAPAVSPGALLRTETVRGLPDTPSFAASGDSTSFTFPSAQAVWSTSGERAEEVVKVTGSPFAIQAGDLVLAQSGERMLAIDRATGSTRWTATMAAAVPGTAPAVRGDIVVVPVRGTALTSYDRRTGTSRWTRRLSSGGTPSSSSPVFLPDGDILYADGGLARYDGRTGRRIWAREGLSVFAPLAVAAGRVYVTGFEHDDTGVVMALDLATGEPLWRAPFVPAVLQPPVVGGGVVAVIDGQLRLRVFSSTDHEKLWSVRLGSEVAGPPVLVDGAVVVDELGHREDVQAANHRVVAYNARDGRFLAAREPAGLDYGFAAFGALGDGLLFVPSFAAGPTGELMRLERT